MIQFSDFLLAELLECVPLKETVHRITCVKKVDVELIVHLIETVLWVKNVSMVNVLEFVERIKIVQQMKYVSEINVPLAVETTSTVLTILLGKFFEFHLFVEFIQEIFSNFSN